MKKKKTLLFIGVALFLALVIVIIGVINSSQWEKDFHISGGDWVPNGYKNASEIGGSMFEVYQKGNPYYEYTICNTTNREMCDVVIVFRCKGGIVTEEKWKYEYNVGSLNPHEERTVRVYHWDMYKDHETKNSSHHIEKIKYDKE